MTTQENKTTTPAKTAPKRKSAPAGRASMTPEEAKKLGLDPKPYGKPAAKK
jgi:hypothetical protein